MSTISVTVQHVSLESLTDAGWEMGDNGQAEREAYGNLYMRDLMAELTPAQRRVAYCLYYKGMKRNRAASFLMVSLQAIHQIIPRMRRRLTERAGIKW